MAIKQIIIIRKDLKMRRGKEIAQGAHASIAWITKRVAGRPMFHRNDQTWQATGYFTDAEREWMQEGFRKITVQVDSEEDLLRVHYAARRCGSCQRADHGLRCDRVWWCTHVHGVCYRTRL